MKCYNLLNFVNSLSDCLKGTNTSSHNLLLEREKIWGLGGVGLVGGGGGGLSFSSAQGELGTGFPCNRTNIADDRSWSNIPFGILHLLADRLKGNLSDLVRVSTVCKSWRCLILDRQWLGFAQQMEALTGMPSLHLPKLVLPERTDSDNRNFFEWSMDKTIQLYLPEARGRRCCGSGHGWLVTVGEDVDIHLLNPMTRGQVRLPSDPRFTEALTRPEHFMTKAIIIGNPSESVNCTVAAFILADLFLVKPGLDEAWTRVTSHLFLTDIADNQGLLYGFSMYLGYIECWRLDPVQSLWFSFSRTIPIPVPLIDMYSHFISYCLEVSGELIGVSRPLLDDPTVLEKGSLVVFKLMDAEWVEVKDLGDCCLFLGENTSMALSSVPPSSKFRRNCIYFAHSRYLEVEIGRYYSLQDGQYEPFFLGGSASQPPSPSLWVTFNPCNGEIN